MRMTAETEQHLQDGGAPKQVYHNRTAWRCATLWAKGTAAKDIHREMLHMYGGRTSIEDEHPVHRPVKEQCVRGSDSSHKYFTPQVSRDL